INYNLISSTKKNTNIFSRIMKQFFFYNFNSNSKSTNSNKNFFYYNINLQASTHYFKIIKNNTFQNLMLLSTSPFFFKYIFKKNDLYLYQQSANFFFYIYKFYPNLNNIGKNNNIIPYN